MFVLLLYFILIGISKTKSSTFYPASHRSIARAKQIDDNDLRRSTVLLMDILQPLASLFKNLKNRQGLLDLVMLLSAPQGFTYSVFPDCHNFEQSCLER